MTTATHLIYYEGHFYEALMMHPPRGIRGIWYRVRTPGPDPVLESICHVGEESGSIPLDMAREIFEEHARKEAERKEPRS